MQQIVEQNEFDFPIFVDYYRFECYFYLHECGVCEGNKKKIKIRQATN